MKKALYSSAILLAIIGAYMLGGARSGSRTPAAHAASHARTILYYVDPMHPAYHSDKPGVAPDCGMQLEPVYAGQMAAVSSGDASTHLPAGAVQIDPAKQQLFGVQVSPVQEASGTYKLRLLGRVTPDEGKVYRLNAGIDGFIQDVSAVTTGSFVRKNQVLGTFSSPNAAMTLQSYLLNMGAEDRFKKNVADGNVEGQSLAAANANIQQRIQQLQNLGMSPLQMEEIRRTRQFPESIKIVSPADGFILARNISPGQKFERDSEWFRIVDLRRVWILTDIFEREAQYVQPGAQVRVMLPGQNKTLLGRVSNALPQFDSATQALKARIEVDNPGFVLRPDMFVDVELPVNFSHAVVVPVGAVLDAGSNKTVFVERGEGLFTPRAVETNRRFDDRVEIVKGLEPGERIVVSGNFLVSSESRMKEAAEAYAPAPATELPSGHPKTADNVQIQPQVKKTAPATQTQPLPASGITPKEHHHGRHSG